MNLVERDDDAKQLRDMADVLYEQGKDAAYIIAALTSYAAEANVALPPTRGAVEALRDMADAAHRDRSGFPLPYEEWRVRYDAALNIIGGQ